MPGQAEDQFPGLVPQRAEEGRHCDDGVGVLIEVAGQQAVALRQRLPGTTWIRLQRLLEDQPSALVLIADGHVSHGPGGAALAMKAAALRWSGTAPARLLRGVGAEVREARRGLHGATVELQACS